ncbi:Jacalin-like lectin domain [Phytophthora infestans]|uniref:Jacalin-like lectin domain n=1 Tax=Phytophthora infestans TaxID=4787 RepID=A0A833TK86_PHYIN|nr:Jacalin-like lectin domain [Phytophthora infestans]
MVDMFTFDDASISIPHWMTDVLEDAGAEPTLAQRPVSGENAPKRTVLYARKGPGSTQRRAGRRELAVPNWFDLPVLLPESHPVAARILRNMVSRAPREGIVKCHDDGAQFTTPKVSRLGSREEEEERKVRKMGALVLKNTTRRRHSTRIRKLDGLGHVDRRKRLREKVWKDLSRFGLWPMAGPGDFNDQQSVEKTVDAIWSQWQDNAEKIPLSGVDSGSNEWGFSIGDCVILDTGDDASGIFLTGVPSVPSCVTPETTETGSEVMNRRRPSVLTDGGGLEAPEEEENNEEEEESSSFGFSATRLQAKVQTPGLKRRKRLTDLHHFVETQLQKRLFRSWDTIEIAFTGSGDMTVNQIVKFLQLSDVQLGNNDAAKVQKILEEHVAAVHATQETNGEGDEEEHLIRGRTKSKAVLSFEGFRQIFHPVDPLEASRWKREFDREKFRQRQEKDIYTRELEALEEKVRQRLATSAKHMIDVLQQFKCDRKDIPWENEQQRQHMRSQFLDVIFRKPQRRRILQHDTRLQHSDLTQTPEAQTTNSAPLKLSIKVILSTLLQKFSRNGHFESVEVPAAAYLYHDLAADIIKQSIRRYWEQFEIDQWPERQIIFRFRMKKQIFYDWRAFAERSRLLCKYVLRKFVAWKYMTRKLHEHYAFYRISFWPFYVWKRHLQQMIIARGKTEFLMNVLRTYIQLRNFRALKLRYKTKQWNKKQITRMRNKKLKKIRRICWATWKDRFQRSRLIRQIWKNHGNTLQQLHKFYMVRVTFYILRYYSILKRDMKQRKYMSLLGQFSATARAKALAHQHQRHHKGTVNHDRAAQQRGSFYPTDNEPSKVSATRRSLPMTTYEPPQHGRGSTAGVRNTRGSVSYLTANDEHHVESSQLHLHPDDLNVDSNDGAVAGSLTRIMETELGKKIKRKSRLYDLCLGMYLKYRERDRINMIGNVIAYRRFGRIFVKYLRTTVHQGKINRFATDLGAFHVLSSRFRQWMIGTVYKLPPATQDGVEPVKKDDEAEETGEKVVLHWREDREWRLLAIANNPVRALQLRQDLLSTMESDAVRKETIRGREQLLTKKQANEDAFLRLETSATLKIKAAQMQQVQQIMRRRAHRLHDAMDNVYDVLLQQQARQQLKSSFRSLRVVVMMKYTSMLCHCAQIRNWLRLCHRFMYWERNMGVFYKQKLKYHAFQTLLKHAVWKWKFQSPRLSQKLQRSQKLMWKYENYMQEQDLFDGSSESLRLAGTRNSPANSFRSILLRWIQFAQCSKARETIVKLSRRKREIWSMHTVFHALKNRVKAKYTYAERCALLPYLWRQCMVDLDTYHCKIIALEQRLPSSHLRAQLTHTRKLMRETAISSPTLKKLFQDHENEVRLRLQLEKRLMLAAYSERAVHKHAERSSSLFGTTAGKPFTHDKMPPFGSISEVGIICGKKVDGICVVLKASGQANIEGSIHGNPFGTHEVFSLGRGEKLVSIEGFASQSIYGLRFGTSVGRYSKWFGHCEKGSKFEVHSDFFSNREEIVGFFGHADNASINSLGVVMRHTTIKNPFEGLWVLKDNHTQHNMLQQSPHRGSVDELPLSDRQFAYFLQVRACEVLMIMERAHLFAIRAYKIEDTLPPALGNMRIIMAMARWMLNALSHGLVQRTEREEEGKQILISGQEKYAVGEKLLSDGTNTMQIVDGFRDSAGQLDAATLGVKKIIELKDKMTQAQQQMVQGERLRDEGQHEIMRSQRFLPHLPTTKRMISAIRTMYKVVQTKDEIDHMNPELRSFLLLKKSGRSEGEALSPLQ